MRRILSGWRPESPPEECAKDERGVTGFTRCSFFDVRLLGAIAAFVIMITLALPTAPDPAQKTGPTVVARGETGTQATSFAFAPTGRHIATTNTTGHVTLRASSGGWHTERFLDFPGYARTVAFSPDGQSLAAAGVGPGVCIWDLASSSPKPTATMTVPGREPTRVLFAPDGRSLAVTTSVDGTIRLFDLVTRQERLVLRHPSPVTTMAFSPDGLRLATGGRNDPWIILWELQTGSCRMMLDDHCGFARALAFSPDSATLASARLPEHRVRLWDVGSWKQSRFIGRHGRQLNSVAFSPDGRLLATAGDDGMLGLWTVATGQQQVTLGVDATWLRFVAFSPDGRSLILVTGGDDDIRVWDLADLLAGFSREPQLDSGEK
jgi:WD40 repeat protein